MTASDRLRLHQVHQQRHRRGRPHASSRRCSSSSCVIFLFLGSLRTVLVPLVAIPVSLIGAVFLMQVLRLHAEPADAARRSCSRWASWSTTPSSSSRTSSGTSARARRRSQASLVGARELVGPIIAMTITLAAVYAPIGFQGGLTGALFREFAFTLAGAVFISGVVALTLSPMMSSQAAAARTPTPALPTARSTGASSAIKRTYSRMLAWTLPDASARSTRSGSSSRCSSSRMYMFSPTELAPERGPGRRLRRHRRAGQRDARAGHPVHRRRCNDNFQSIPEFDHSFQITFPTGGFGGMLVKPWEERKRSIFAHPGGARPEARRDHGHPRAGRSSRRRCPSAGHLPGRVRDRLDGEPRGARARRRSRLSLEAHEERAVRLPADHRRAASTRPRRRSSSTATRSPRWGSPCSRSARTSSAMLGGNFVNRFNIDGRSYKVIPQIERAGRLTADQLGGHPRHRPGRAAHAARRRRHHPRRASSRAR